MIKILNEKLELKSQESWDNGGLQIGDYCSDINNIMLTMDINLKLIEYAINNNINLIITHHPFLFSGLKSIDFSTYEGSLIKLMINNDINLYSMHTSYDMAEYGVTHSLAKILKIDSYEVLHVVNPDGSGYGGIGCVEPINIVEFAKQIKKLLNADYIKLYCNKDYKTVRKAAFCGGSGSDFIKDAIAKEADVYITGDIKYHQAQFALQNNLCIIDAGHYNTEYQSLQNIKNILDTEGLKVTLMEVNTVNEIIL
ncbi:Nif3-like dinuclear metal center hexameric protein [Sedimentibacter hydroxybenzoicus]